MIVNYLDIDFEWLISEVKIQNPPDNFRLHQAIFNILREKDFKYNWRDVWKIVYILCELSNEIKIIASKDTLINDLVGVQPMTAPIGHMYNIKYEYSSDKKRNTPAQKSRGARTKSVGKPKIKR